MDHRSKGQLFEAVIAVGPPTLAITAGYPVLLYNLVRTWADAPGANDENFCHDSCPSLLWLHERTSEACPTLAATWPIVKRIRAVLSNGRLFLQPRKWCW